MLEKLHHIIQELFVYISPKFLLIYAKCTINSGLKFDIFSVKVFRVCQSQLKSSCAEVIRSSTQRKLFKLIQNLRII